MARLLYEPVRVGPIRLPEAVRQLLGVEVTAASPVGGGCISEAQRMTLADGRMVFAKSGAGLPDGLLSAEAGGLAWLREAAAIRVPEVLAQGSDPPVLVMEWIEPGPAGPTTATELGTGLAHLHLAGAPAFGAARDGFIGSLPQSNTPPAPDDWPSFWFSRRIGPLARRAVDRGSLARAAVGLVERLGGRLVSLCGPPEPPARVHGDLWSGNVLTDRNGHPWVVDPAAYGGHREVDLAMLHLFGRPDPEVVAAYQQVRPLAEGWRQRLQLWQLEPLLVHAVLFGGGYGAQVQARLADLTH